MPMEILNPSHIPDPPGDGFSGLSSPGNLRRDIHRRILPAEPALPEIVEEGGGDLVHVAVGKSTQKAVWLLKWTFQRFQQREICFVHVHQPSAVIPTLLGKLPASQANGEVVSSYRREEKAKMGKLLSDYLNFCSRSKVKASYIMTEADQVDKGIVDLVNKHRIRKLVMGAVPKMRNKIGKKANYAAKYAPPFCEIWFVNKGRHLWTREASTDINYLPPLIPQQCANLEILKSKSLQDHTSQLIFPSEYLRSRSCCEDSICRPLSILSSTCDQRRFCSLSSLVSTGTDALYPSSAELRVPSDSEMSYPNVLEPRVEDGGLAPLTKGDRSEAEASKNEVLTEKLKCEISESKAMDAIDKVRAFRTAHAHEVNLRKEAEDALRRTIQEQEMLLEESENVTAELQKTMRSVALLDRRAEEAKRRCEEAAEELRFIDASIATLQCERETIQRQKMESVHWLEQRRSRGQMRAANSYQIVGVVDDSTQLTEFSLSDLETATCNFSESFKIGQGGYGCVYKGEMMDTTVAIKRLHPHSIQGQSEFQQEVQVLSKLRHPHLVSLIGTCPEAWSLVYEYLPNGSLQDHLFKKRNTSLLTWKIRTRIIAEISSALLFLHSSNPSKVVHGNLKPENILLDSELSCKICDFGISGLVHEETLRCPSFCQYTEPKSTFPYTDPEFCRTGVLTTKSDIYAFGLITLQLLTGRPPMGLASEVRKAVLFGKLEAVLDSSAGEWPTYVSRQLVDLALQCCELNSRDRPELRPSLVTELEQLHVLEERPVPSIFLCPIRREIMHDPQIAADGFTYEGEALRGWLENGRETSPMTNLKLTHLHLTPNHALRLAIQDWLCKS